MSNSSFAVKGREFHHIFPIFNASGNLVINPAVNDSTFKITKNGTLVNLSVLPTVLPDSPFVKITLTEIEMNAEIITIHSTSSDWKNIGIVIRTDNNSIDDVKATIDALNIAIGSIKVISENNGATIESVATGTTAIDAIVNNINTQSSNSVTANSEIIDGISLSKAVRIILAVLSGKTELNGNTVEFLSVTDHSTPVVTVHTTAKNTRETVTIH